MPLPIILAGPILRRVQQDSVSVWIALSEPADVELTVFQGAVNATAPSGANIVRGQSKAPLPKTTRIGAHLHILVVTLELEAPNQLVSGTLYSYDLKIKPANGAETTLQDMGLLNNAPRDGHEHEPLGYVPDMLPSFAMAPQNLEQFSLLHGSCRKPHGPGRDALAYADAMIDGNLLDPDNRPHMLFLTGDQIYADEVAIPLLPHFTALGQNILEGTPESISAQTSQANVAQLEIDQENFPAGFRQSFVENCAAFTSSAARCHLLSFGEYAAHYLCSWCNEVWPSDLDDLETFDEQLVRIQSHGPVSTQAAFALFGKMGKNVTPQQRETFVNHLFGLGMAADLSSARLAKVIKRIEPDWLKKANIQTKLAKYDQDTDIKPTLTFARSLSDADLKIFRGFFEDLREALEEISKESVEELDHIREFYRTLPKVRRVLANVPTRMIWDDHDVTDDWNLTSTWVSGVDGSTCGKAIVRNGMSAYALFQDWGNRPGDYDAGGAKKVLVDHITKLFEAGPGPWPNATAAAGLDGEFAKSGDDTLPWHYDFEGPDFKGLVLNTRTERGFDGPFSAPNLLPLIGDAGPLARQVPKDPMILDDQVLIVISPVPVLGLPVMEQVGQVAAVSVIDFVSVARGGKRMGATAVDSEAWALHREGFEQLLLRLAPQRRVVFLSGDIHFGAAARLDHWRKDVAEATHFVQFTSSPCKNVWPEAAVMATESFGLAHRILELHGTSERMGWLGKEPQPIAFAQNVDFPMQLLFETEREPVLIPVYPDDPLWQGLSSNRDADLLWRQTLLRDDRPNRPDVATPPTLPDDDRFVAVTPPAPPDVIAFEAARLKAYGEVLTAHGDFLHKQAFARSTLWLNNLGRISFEDRSGGFTAVQELWASHPAEPETSDAVVMTEYRTRLQPNFPDQPPKLAGDP